MWTNLTTKKHYSCRLIPKGLIKHSETYKDQVNIMQEVNLVCDKQNGFIFKNSPHTFLQKSMKLSDGHYKEKTNMSFGIEMAENIETPRQRFKVFRWLRLVNFIESDCTKKNFNKDNR